MFQDATGRQSGLGEFLDRELYPALFERLDVAFPEFGWERHGGSWTANHWPTGFPYPVQEERPSRLMVYPDRPWWIKVHGHRGVRFLDYLNGGRKPYGQEFPTLVQALAERVGKQAPQRVLTPEAVEAARRREVRRAILEVVVGHCQDALWSEQGAEALSYLQGRGLTEEDICRFGLGLYARAWNVEQALRAGGFESAAIRDSAAVWQRMEGYITFPWRDAYGQLLTLYGRWPGEPPDERPKTIALPGAGSKASPLYFNLARREGHRHIVLVEGVLDALYLQTRGDSRVVACVAAELSGDQVQTLKYHRVNAVTISLDPDEGGDRGILSCIESLGKAGITAYVAPRLPDGLDPDEFAARDGIEAWRTHIAQAIPGAIFRAEQLLGNVSPEAPDIERRAAVGRVQAFLETLSGPQAPLDREDILTLTAQRTGYPVPTLLDEAAETHSVASPLLRPNQICPSEQPARSRRRRRPKWSGSPRSGLPAGPLRRSTARSRRPGRRRSSRTCAAPCWTAASSWATRRARRRSSI